MLVHLHVPRHEKDGAWVVDADPLVILLVEPLCAAPIKLCIYTAHVTHI